MSGDYSEQIRQIGLRIAYFRKLKRLTQADLATILNINKTYLSQIECGLGNKSVSLPLLIRISEKLDIPLAKLVDIEKA